MTLAFDLRRLLQAQTRRQQEVRSRYMHLLSTIRGDTYTRAAEEIASSLSRDIPPSLSLQDLNLSANRLTTILERRFVSAEEFQSKNPMNWLRRAQFANAFRWKLAEMGYGKDLVEVATEGLVHQLTRTARKKPA